MSHAAALAARCTRMTYDEAMKIAEELQALFADVCDRIEIAGSLRRKKQQDIKDVELLMIPKLIPLQIDLFGENIVNANAQFERAQELRREGVLRDRLASDGKAAFGERFQRVIYKDTAVDLFICLPPAQWGIKLILATGPKDFNIKMFTPWANGGRVLMLGQRLEDGVLIDRGRLVETPTEESVFQYLGREFIPPEERS